MNEKRNGRRPDYRNDGVSAWVNEDTGGRRCLKLILFNTISIWVNEFDGKGDDPKAPDFKSDCVSVWENVSKEGRRWIHAIIFDSIRIRVYEYMGWDGVGNGHESADDGRRCD